MSNSATSSAISKSAVDLRALRKALKRYGLSICSVCQQPRWIEAMVGASGTRGVVKAICRDCHKSKEKRRRDREAGWI
jgi:hypothetical protein